MDVRLLVTMLFLAGFAVRPAAGAQPTWRFDLGDGPVAKGHLGVRADNRFGSESQYGFEPGAGLKPWSTRTEDAASCDGLVSEDPFSFSVVLPEGNWRVRLTLGGAEGGSICWVKSECRALVLERIIIPAGEVRPAEFSVNVRTPQIRGGSMVRLKEREKGIRRWDDRLTLEFLGQSPCVAAIEVLPEPGAVTLFIAGDSTVTDQPEEPWAGWGQMLPCFFGPGLAVANHAESGESLASSRGSRRFDKIFSAMRPGDWLLVQFGHNDMKDRAADSIISYRRRLLEVVEETRRCGGIPLLVTSMERKAGLQAETLGEYPDTVREVAAEMGVNLIDLNRMSLLLYHAWGDEIHRAFQDGSHCNNYGAYELARCVVQGIRRTCPDLARLLGPGVGQFDPTRPDSPAGFDLPPSRQGSSATPDGY